jgi:hypothetical protein
MDLHGAKRSAMNSMMRTQDSDDDASSVAMSPGKKSHRYL